jgi:ribonuclease R
MTKQYEPDSVEQPHSDQESNRAPSDERPGPAPSHEVREVGGFDGTVLDPPPFDTKPENLEDPADLEERIVRHVSRTGYHPVKPRVITKQLGLPPDARSRVRKAIRRLAKRGSLQYGAKHLVRPLEGKRQVGSDEPTRSKLPSSPPGERTPSERRRRKLPDSRPELPDDTLPEDALPRETVDWDADNVPENDGVNFGEDEDRDIEKDVDDRQESAWWGENEADEEGEDPEDVRRAGKHGEKRGQPKKGTEITGTFRRASGGFGFVRPHDATRDEGRTRDIFISAKRSLDAASGDVVRVQLKRGSGGRRREGQDPQRQGVIVEVLEREEHRFVGSYFERGGSGLVQVDGRVFQQPIPVGDPGAKNVREGDQVVIEMVHFPTHFDAGEAVVIEVLGARGAPGVDTLAIMREYDLPDEFPLAVLQESREQAEEFDESIPEDRRDLTGETIITIDPVDARDFDDAISLERRENGHWLLGVHIADVAHFVPVGSSLDREARRRGTSVYLPDRVIPMLPEIISNHLASLQPDRVRYARSVFVEFTPEGIAVSTEFTRSAIRSCRRFSYEEVDDFLEQPERWSDRLKPDVSALLLRMRDLAMLLRQKRLDAGAIELVLPEVKIVLDEAGRVGGAKLTKNTVSHQLIEEFMLAANRAVAEMLHGRNLLFLRRIHEPPAIKKLRSLTEFIRELGLPCDSMESRFEIKRVIAAVKGEPTEHAVNYAILRSLQKAVYGPEESGHYALHWDHYCHFTSPIRRYPDLDVHRMLEDLQRGKRPRSQRGELRTLGEHCSDREQRAEAAERELIKLKLLHYLKDHLGMQMPAVITGVEEFGLFAQGIELPAEGFIAVSSLQDDFYRFDATTHTLSGHRSGNQFRLGDRVTVEVVQVDLARRELDLRIVEHEVSPRRAGPTGKRGKGAGKPRSRPSGSKRNRPKRKR